MSYDDNDGMVDDGFGSMFGSGSKGAPAISWDPDVAPIGSGFEGILIKNERTQQIDFDTQRPTFWDDIKMEVTTTDTGRPMMQDVVTVLTTFGQFQMMSENAVARKQKYGEEDDGLRRWFVKGGKNGTKKLFEAAVSATGARSPQRGGVINVKIVKRTKVPKANFFEVTYTRPTAESLARLSAWEDSDGARELATAGARSSASKASTPVQDEQPPF